MNQKMKKIAKILLGLLLLLNPTLFAQDAQMADTMRSEGKILPMGDAGLF